MISSEELNKYRFNPKLKDKDIRDLFYGNNKEKIIELFKLIKTNEFYNYLIKNNLVIYFEASEIISLLDNSAFLNYLIHTDINIFNNIEDKDYTKELVLMIDSNYYTFLNSNFDFAAHPILFSNPSLSDLIIDDLDSVDDFINILNNSQSSKILTKVINKIKENNFDIDIEKLEPETFTNPIIGEYLVFSIDLNNINLLKGEAYKQVYAKILEMIQNNELSFAGYTKETFPEALYTKAVFDKLVINPKNYEIITFFPKEFHDSKSDYILSMGSDDELKKEIFTNNAANDDFFNMYIESVSEDNSQYLDYFDYDNLSRDSIKYMVDCYLRGNRFVRTFFLRLEDRKISNIDLIYDAIILKEQSNDIVISSILKYVDALLCSQKTIFLVYKLFAINMIDIASINESFWCSNDFLNMFIANGRVTYINRFKSPAYEPNNLFIDNESLIETITGMQNEELFLYLKKYLKHFDLDNLLSNKGEKVYKSSMISKYGHKNAEIIEFLCMSGKRSPHSCKYLNSDNTLYAFENFGNVVTKKTSDYLNSLNLAQLNKINTSHVRHIYNMLNNYIYCDEDKLIIALNMYLTLGYSRSTDILNSDINKNYGKVNEDILKKMFLNLNVSNVTFMQYGNGFLPIINDELINIIFGMNYKIEDTPIKLYLRKPEIKKINSQESQKLLNRLSNINKFFDGNFAYAIANWNLIKEEYYRKQNVSKLKSRLNINEINEIIDSLTRVKTLLGPEDRYLMFSDVFKYAGKDNQYVGINYRDVPKRVIELSRYMEGQTEKYFPNINFIYEDYSLNTYNPADRQILSAGYKSDCCFRALAEADKDGGENSFLKYCCSTKAGGGIEILDKNGKMIAFSPVMVSGNVLIIHSVESIKMDAEGEKKVFKILEEYGKKIIADTSSSQNKIDYVCVTNSKFYDDSTPREKLQDNKRFVIYDPKCHYYGMYSNLGNDQFIVTSRDNMDQDSINYNQEMTTYKYPQLSLPYSHISFDQKTYEHIKALDFCDNLIIELSNRRFRKDKNSNESYKLLQDINHYKKEHLDLYQRIFNIYHYDIYSDYKMGVKLASEFANELTIDDFALIKEFYYSANWYITVGYNNRIKYHYSEEGESECLAVVENLQKERKNANARRSRKLQ